MTVDDALRELRALGSNSTRAIYRRHGVGEDVYGVSFANLGKLKKRIKVDHALAEALWATGNHDARVLATMIADPRLTSEALLTRWAADLDNYALTDSFVGLAARTPHARALMERWTPDDGEWTGRAGWHLLAQLAMHDSALPDAFFEPYLAVIEREIHGRKNRVRDAMNNALIAIGMRDGLEAQALAAAARIGTVRVDHGQTGCKTPDAAAYIHKTRERRRPAAAAGAAR